MQFLQAWPLNHFLTLTRINDSIRDLKIYYDVDRDVFVTEKDLDGLNPSDFTRSATYMIVGKKATIKAIYASINKGEVPSVPPEIQSVIDMHTKQNKVLALFVSSEPAVSEQKPRTPVVVVVPAAPAAIFVPPSKINIERIYNVLSDGVKEGSCINIFTGASAKIDKNMVLNANPAYPLCYVSKSKDAKNVKDKDELFRHVENEIEKKRQSEQKKQPIPRDVISENEKNKLANLEKIKNSKRSPNGKRSPSKQQQQLSPKPTARGPLPTTLEMDTKFPNEMGKLKLDIDDYESVNAPVNGDIIKSINDSENRMSKRSIPKGRSLFESGIESSSDEEPSRPNILSARSPRSSPTRNGSSTGSEFGRGNSPSLQYDDFTDQDEDQDDEENRVVEELDSDQD